MSKDSEEKKNIITFENVTKTFGLGNSGLLDISLTIEKGDFTFLVGETGSGKTTLLRLLIREVLPSKGRIIINDWDIVKLPGHKIPHLRKKIGIVFQDLKLLFDRTVFENILLPLEVAGVRPSDAKRRADEVMAQVGIEVHKHKFPIQLSGGEMQRVAIARALVLSPDIFLADEPTGNLDPATSKDIVKLLSDINEQGTTVLMATHNVEVVNSLSKRVIALKKGKITRDERKGKYGST